MASINRNNGAPALKALSGSLRENRLWRSLRPAFELSYFHREVASRERIAKRVITCLQPITYNWNLPGLSPHATLVSAPQHCINPGFASKLFFEMPLNARKWNFKQLVQKKMENTDTQGDSKVMPFLCTRKGMTSLKMDNVCTLAWFRDDKVNIKNHAWIIYRSSN